MKREAAFKALLALVHALFTAYELIIGAWSAVKRLIPASQPDREELRSRSGSLKKIPRHLAVILGPEPPSYQDLANLIAWSVASGIPFISFHDHNGLLKRSENELVKEVTRRTGLNYEDGELNNGCQNGMSRRIRIKVFGGNDGQRCVVTSTKSLLNVKGSTVDIDCVDRCLRKSLGNMPDPDLALICGQACSIFGYLPWQVRVTEFVNIHTHYNITLDQFLSTLDFYGKCEQRFGK